MEPTVWASLILVTGGVLLAIAGIFTVRTAAKWPELIARVTQTEITANEALEIATKARRLASRQRTRATKEEAPDAGVATAPGTQNLLPIFQPGMTAHGVRFNGAALSEPSQGGGVHPVGFVDE